MAYVRRRGRQVAIVQGQRDPSTGKVDQRVLFVFYSRPEAHEAMGKEPDRMDGTFRHLLEEQFPRLRFDWKTIRRQMEAVLDTLPPEYAGHEGDRRAEFRRDLGSFVRRLLLTHPQESSIAAALIREHWIELEYVIDVIRGHLKLAQDSKLTYWRDDASRWRWAQVGNEVPPDAEEQAEGYFERRELDRAEAVFKLLVECFDRYAEGYNYLGLIALQRGRSKEAAAWFEKAVSVGRHLFPKRIGRARYWNDISTRPYMRGLRNLAYALETSGRHEEALALCDRLDQECGDDISASALRAEICLNLRRWEDAARESGRLKEIHPSESFTAAFALAGLKRWEEALGAFLHGALNHPHAAPVLAGRPPKQPTDYEEQEDNDLAEESRKGLKGYFSKQGPESRRFFERIIAHPKVRALLDEIKRLKKEWRRMAPQGDRTAFRRINEMQSTDFARARAAELRDLHGGTK